MCLPRIEAKTCPPHRQYMRPMCLRQIEAKTCQGHRVCRSEPQKKKRSCQRCRAACHWHCLRRNGPRDMESPRLNLIPMRSSCRTVSVSQPTKQCFATIAQVKSGSSTLASLSNAKPHMRSACDWVRLTGKQSTRENNGVDGVTYVL